MREYNRKNPGKGKNTKLKRIFGISLKHYYQLLAKQRWACAICLEQETAIDGKTGLPFSLAVDHNHDTGAVRGLLCMKCNRAIGLLKDNVNTLQAAIVYLKRNM